MQGWYLIVLLMWNILKQIDLFYLKKRLYLTNKTKQMKVLILIFVLSSCSLIEPEGGYIDPSLKNDFNTIQGLAIANNHPIDTRHLILKWGSSNDIADCEKINTLNGSYHKIVLNNGIRGYDSLALQYVMLHEIGHFFGRSHNKIFSIMNPNTYAADYHNSLIKRDSLIKELFKR